MFQVKTISLNTFDGLEDRINEFLSSRENGSSITNVIDIKYGTHNMNGHTVYYASIIFERG